MFLINRVCVLCSPYSNQFVNDIFVVGLRVVYSDAVVCMSCGTALSRQHVNS